MKFLRIATWNINGLSPNKDEVEVFLNYNKIDVLLLSETHMTDERSVKIQGYNIYFCNHPDGTSHAGAAVVIKENIKQHALPNFRHDYLQAAVVSVDEWQGKLTLAAIYCPPRHKITEIMFTDFFSMLGSRYITGGDWNSKNTYWGSRLTTSRGRELKKSVDKNRLNVVSTGEPTYWPSDPNKTPDLIDFFITRGATELYTKVESCLDGSSDHTPLICTLSTTVIYKEPQVTLHNKMTDWEAFRDYIERNANLQISLKTEEEVEEAARYATNLFQTAAWLSTPPLELKSQNTDYAIEIKNKINEKRRLRRQWQINRTRQDKKALNLAQEELKVMININVNETLQDKLRTLSPYHTDDYSLWKITKSLKRPTDHVPPIRQKNGTWAKTCLDKAELFAQYLEDTFKPNEADQATHSEEEIDAVINCDQQMSLPLPLMTPKEVYKAVQNLKLKKAPGHDLITAEVLKQLPKKGIVLLTILFNAVLRLQYYPLLWKVSAIIMIAKPGKPPSDVASYRPISLLPVISKLFEKLLLKRLLPILEEKKIIPNHQFGFRAHHGTLEQIHRVAHRIRQALENKEYCSAVLLDVQQAFDRVWHKGLLCKLKICLPNTAYMLLKSYLEERIFQVKCDDNLSSFKNIEAGVPQGSVLGPVLYTIYTADIPTSDQVLTATYADDTALLSCSKTPELASSNLQMHLNKIGLWLKKWRIKTSASKSTQVTFTLRKGDCPPVSLDGINLPQKNTVKYLGMHLDRRLNWKNHIKAKREQANRKLGDLYWLIGRKSCLSLENKLLIYKCVIKPIWTYGIELWGTASHSNIEILQRFQNKTLKIITNAPWFVKNKEVHEYTAIHTIKEEVETSCTRYKLRLREHKNKLATSMLNTTNNVYRLKRQRLASI